MFIARLLSGLGKKYIVLSILLAAGADVKSTNVLGTGKNLFHLVSQQEWKQNVQFLDDEIYLRLNEDLIDELIRGPNPEILLDIPFFEDRVLTAQLQQINAFADDAIIDIVSKSGSKSSFDRGKFFVGQFKDCAKSLISIHIAQGEISCCFSLEGKNYNISQTAKDKIYALFSEDQINIASPYSCSTDDEQHFVGQGESDGLKTNETCIGVYFEVDYDLILAKGSITEAYNHFAGIFNQVKLLYLNEGIQIYIKELKIWDIPDPYTGSTVLNNLYAFKNELNGNFNGDIAHLVGQKGNGGVAYIETLCEKNFAVAYSDINATYEEIPVYSWAVKVLAHEIGHNLGSRHTHSCVWNGNDTAIDGCGPEAGFSEGCDAALPDKGTIMSYCQLVESVGIDFNLGFGVQPGDLIRNNVFQANCLSNCEQMDCVLEGQACNDNDDCTEGDYFDAECNCISGIQADQDNDGFCAAIDPDDNDICNPDITQGNCAPDSGCENYSNTDFETNLGEWVDGGNDVVRGKYPAYASSGLYCVRLRDNSGVNSSLITKRLFIEGKERMILRFSFFPKSMENGEELILKLSLDGAENYQTLKRWTIGENISDLERVEVDILYEEAFTNHTYVRIECNASSNADQVYIDDLYLEFCSPDSNCTLEGQDCDDGVACTEGEQYDENCNCTGGINNDSDGDGICDAIDMCPNFNDNLIGEACDDLDVCTINDVFTGDCGCEGEYFDEDFDGFCSSEDPDDLDPCVPDPIGSNCEGENSCIEMDISDFEYNLGIWKDGGVDAVASSSFASYASSGSSCVRLRDNAGVHSSIYTEVLDLSNFTSLELGFHFIASSMEAGEDLILEISLNGGNSFVIAEAWVSGEDFSNNVVYNFKTTLDSYQLSQETVLRLRCDASSNADRVYIDDIVLSACGLSPDIANDPNQEEGLQKEGNEKQDVILFPNPIKHSEIIHLRFENIVTNISVKIMGVDGAIKKEIKEVLISSNHMYFSTEGIASGVYFLEIIADNKFRKLEKLMIH